MKNKNTIICLLIIVVLILGSYICYDKFFSDKPTNDKDEPKVEEKKEEVETEVTDVNLIKELSNKVDAISIGFFHKKSFNDFTGDYSSNTDFFAITEFSSILKNTMSDQIKQRIILNSLQGVKVKIESSNSNNELLKNYDGWELDKISKEQYEKRSIELFNKVINNDSQVSWCPGYIYDETSNAFYEVSQCGFSVMDSLMMYKYKFTSKADDAYIYVSTAYSKYIDDQTHIIYKNYNLESSDMVSESDIYPTTGIFTLGKDNYNDFVKYRYNFKKNENGNYYFVGVEKI